MSSIFKIIDEMMAEGKRDDQPEPQRSDEEMKADAVIFLKNMIGLASDRLVTSRGVHVQREADVFKALAQERLKLYFEKVQ